MSNQDSTSTTLKLMSRLPQLADPLKKYKNFCVTTILQLETFERTVEKINLDTTMYKWELENNLNTFNTKWSPNRKKNWELDYML